MNSLLEDVTRKVAGVMGEQSASAQAIKELDRQRALGKDSELEKCGQTIFVISRQPFAGGFDE